VEIIVVVSIVLLISMLVLVGHANFRGNILLTNLAYDVALSIRQAQVYGLSAREATISGSDFDTGYGVRFDANTPNSYILFADLDRDYFYDGDVELVQVFAIRRGYSIADICGINSTDDQNCSVDYLDIVFDRPEPDAIITDNNNTNYTSARIFVRSPQGTERTVEVIATGQIAVNPGEIEIERGADGDTEPPPSGELAASCSVDPAQSEGFGAVVGQDVTWSAAVSGGEPPYSFYWLGSAPLGGQTSQIVVVQYDTSGSKTGEVIVSDSAGHGTGKIGCGSNVAVSNPGFQVSCVADPSSFYGTGAFVGQDVVWSSTVSGGVPPYTYFWVGSAPLYGQTTPTVTVQYDTAGSKTGAVAVSDSAGQATSNIGCDGDVPVSETSR